jgi:multiple sugar transport system substrate-binding protein
VWDNAAFKSKYAAIPGYIDTFQKTAPNTSMLFTPLGQFMQVTTEWAGAVQDMVAGADVQTRLNSLKAQIDQMVAQ